MVAVMASCLRKSFVVFLVCVFVYGCDAGLTLLEDGQHHGHGRYKRTSVIQPELNITSFHIESNITSRFTTTTVVMVIYNRADTGKEVKIAINMPKLAFMTNFTMETGGYRWAAEVKTKAAAKIIYDEAVRSGQTAGHLYTTDKLPRYSSSHEASITVRGCDSAIFTLQYQEFLERSHGFYTNIIFVDPGQVVRDFRIVVNINETRGVERLLVPEIMTSDLFKPYFKSTQVSYARMVHNPTKNQLRIIYEPPIDAQRKYVGTDKSSARFEVLYDIGRNLDAGDLLYPVGDGYFVHFFSPGGFPTLPKRIVFALDVSGSMYGHSIRQVKQAMLTIIGDLRSNDKFNILTFSSKISVWKQSGMVDASDGNKNQAKTFINNLVPRGMTDIHSALIRAVDLVAQGIDENTNTFNVITLLTDGHPTIGETITKQILINVAVKNRDNYPISTLSFGPRADFDLLLKIAKQNSGLARKIYADSDAALQMEHFYDQLGNPVLISVNLQYFGNINPTQTVMNMDKGATLFSGQEIVSTGMLLNPQSNSPPYIHASAYSANSHLDMALEPRRVDTGSGLYRGFTERLWAFLTVRKLSQEVLTATSDAKRNQLKQKATQLALKYKFVTDFTSMVVTPDTGKRVKVTGWQSGRSSGGSHANPALIPNMPAKSVSVPRRRLDSGRSQASFAGIQGIQGKRGFSGLAPRPVLPRIPDVIIGATCPPIPTPPATTGPFPGEYRMPNTTVIDKAKMVLSISQMLICAPAVGVDKGFYNLFTDTSSHLEVRGEYIKVGNKVILDKVAIKRKTGLLTSYLEITPKEIKPPGPHYYTWNEYGPYLRSEAVMTEQCHNNRLTIVNRNGALLVVGINQKSLYFYVKNPSGFPTSVTGLIGQFAHAQASVGINSLDFTRPSGCSGSTAPQAMTKTKRLVAKVAFRQVNCWEVEENLACNPANTYRVNSLVS